MVRSRIDPFSLIPKYHQLFNILRTKIEDGEWEENQTIPSERELEKTYNVSRTTIRQALAQLQDLGFVYRKLGKGTFVAPQKLQNSLHVLTSFSDDMKERELIPGQKILDLDFVEPPVIARQQLELPNSIRQVLLLRRLRMANDIPIGLHFAYLPLQLDQFFTVEDIETHGSLYELLHSKFNLIPTNAFETLEATIADQDEASLLEISLGSPLLLIERTVWSQTWTPMEFVKILYRGDRYKYFAHLSR